MHLTQKKKNMNKYLCMYVCSKYFIKSLHKINVICYSQKPFCHVKLCSGKIGYMQITL